MQKSGTVIRVRLVFKNGEYRLVKSRVVPKMTLLKPIELPENMEVTGNFVELTDTEGRVLYRTNYTDVSDPHVLVSNDDGTFSHVMSKLTERHLEILIPDIEGALNLQLYGAKEGEISRKVFSLSINDIKKSIEPKNGKK